MKKLLDFQKYFEDHSMLDLNKQLNRLNITPKHNSNDVFHIKKISKNNKLTDHTLIQCDHLYSWNTLHHFSYNGTHEFLTPTIASRVHAIDEHTRYKQLAIKILDILQNNLVKCFSCQEIEFSIYNHIVQQVNQTYFCRFIPHRITVMNQTDINSESFGLAIFLPLHSQTLILRPYISSTSSQIAADYKFLVVKNQSTIYTSIHFPVMPISDKIKQKKWIDFFFEDVQKILNEMTYDIQDAYLIGDFNLLKYNFKKLMSIACPPEMFEVNILENNGVDYIVKIVKKTSNKV